MNRRDLLSALTLVPFAARAQALPPPAHGRPGLVRVGGTPAIAPVVAAWKRAFEANNPGIRIEPKVTGSDIAMAGLYTATCDVALIGREATKPEIQAFEWVYRFRPRGVPALAGSVATPGASPAVTVMVHRGNPLALIDLDGLRAAFGDGDRRARVWGDLGLAGAWRDRPIHLFAPDAESGTGRFFRATVLDGSNRMAWARLREFPVPPRPESAEAAVAAALRQALARDPAGLAIGVGGHVAGIRTVPVKGRDGIARLPTPAAIADRSYPLARTLNAYFAEPATGKPHAETLAFLRFMLTPEAQALAARNGPYLGLGVDDLRESAASLS